MTFAVILMSIIMVLITIYDDFVAGLFTTDPEDMLYIHEVLDLISAYLVLDAVHGVNTGIVRALGKQFKASVATLCCYYILGMPLALVLGFKLEMGVRGFWLGFTCALLLQDIIVTLIIVCTDWDSVRADKEISEESKQLLEDDQGSLAKSQVYQLNEKDDSFARNV